MNKLRCASKYMIVAVNLRAAVTFHFKVQNLASEFFKFFPMMWMVKDQHSFVSSRRIRQFHLALHPIIFAESSYWILMLKIAPQLREYVWVSNFLNILWFATWYRQLECQLFFFPWYQHRKVPGQWRIQGWCLRCACTTLWSPWWVHRGVICSDVDKNCFNVMQNVKKISLRISTT